MKATNSQMQTKPSLLIFILLLIFSQKLFAQSPTFEGLWYNEEKTSKINIFKTETGKFCGKVSWLKIPLRDGKPKTDRHNPDKDRQNDPVIGLLILKGFTKTGENTYENGTIYDPKNGKTYSCRIVQNGDKLDIRGYIGFSFIGRTTYWTKAE